MAIPPAPTAPYSAPELAAFPYQRLMSPLPPGATFSTVYAFGDSLSDAGNAYGASANLAPISPPYSSGRFSNGPVWVQNLFKSLGYGTLTSSLSGGNDFAYGGAISGSIPGKSAGPLDLPTQLIQFQTEVPKPQAGALYTLSIGGNDLLDLINDDPATKAAGVAAAVSNEAKFISALADAGGRSFLVLNVPDLGKTPHVAAGGAVQVQAGTQLAQAFDQSLAQALAQLAASAHLNIGIVDTFSLLDQVTANPAAFGFTNATQPVWSGNFDDPTSGKLAASDLPAQDKYVFFDDLHPTESTHALIAAAAQTTLV